LYFGNNDLIFKLFGVGGDGCLIVWCQIVARFCFCFFFYKQLNTFLFGDYGRQSNRLW